MRSANLLVALSAVIAVLALGYLAWRVDWVELTAAFRATEWLWLLPLPAGFAAAVMLRSLRLARLLGMTGRYREVMHIQNIGYLANNIVPLRAGEIAMVMLFGRVAHIGHARALAAIAIDRIIDLVATVMIFLGVAASLPRVTSLAWYSVIGFGAAGFAALATMVVFAAQRRRVRRLLLRPHRLRRGAGRRLVRVANRVLLGAAILQNPFRALEIVGLTALYWLFSASLLWLAVRSAWGPIPLPATALALSAAAIGIAVTSAPGGLGVLHASVVFGLSFFAVPEANALVAAIVFHAVGFTMVLVLGVWSLRHFGGNLRRLITKGA